MGVKGLWSIVAPVGVRVNPEIFTGKRIAIDVSIWLYELTYANNMKVLRNGGVDNMSMFNDLWMDFSENMNTDMRTENLRKVHLYFFFLRICKLLYYNIRPIFIFDGTPPELKRKTIFQRNMKRRNDEERFQKTAEKLIYNYYQRSLLKTLKGKRSTSKKKIENEEGVISQGQSSSFVGLNTIVGRNPPPSSSSPLTLSPAQHTYGLIEIYDSIRENEASLGSMVENIGNVAVSVKDILNICNDEDLNKIQNKVLMISNLEVPIGGVSENMKDKHVQSDLKETAEKDNRMDEAVQRGITNDENEYAVILAGEYPTPNEQINHMDNEIDEEIVRKKHMARKKYYESIPKNFKGFLCMRRPVDIIDISNYSTDILEFTRKLGETQSPSRMAQMDELVEGDTPGKDPTKGDICDKGEGVGTPLAIENKEHDSAEKKGGEDNAYVLHSGGDTLEKELPDEESPNKEPPHPEQINVLELPSTLDPAELFREGKDEYKVYYVNNEEIRIPLFKELNKEVFEKLPIKLQYQILQDIKEEWYVDNRVKAIKAKDDMDIFSQVQLETYVRMIKTDFEIEKLKIKMAENIQNAEGELIVNKELSKHFDNLSIRDYNDMDKKKKKKKKKKYINEILNQCYFEGKNDQYQELYIKEEEEDEKGLVMNAMLRGERITEKEEEGGLLHDQRTSIEAYGQVELARRRDVTRPKRERHGEDNEPEKEKKALIKMEEEFKQDLLLDDEELFGEDLLRGVEGDGRKLDDDRLDDDKSVEEHPPNGETTVGAKDDNAEEQIPLSRDIDIHENRNFTLNVHSSGDDFENCSVEEKGQIIEMEEVQITQDIIDLTSHDEQMEISIQINDEQEVCEASNESNIDNEEEVHDEQVQIVLPSIPGGKNAQVVSPPLHDKLQRLIDNYSSGEDIADGGHFAEGKFSASGQPSPEIPLSASVEVAAEGENTTLQQAPQEPQPKEREREHDPIRGEEEEISEAMKKVKQKVRRFITKEKINQLLLNKVDLDTIGKDTYLENVLSNKVLLDGFGLGGEEEKDEDKQMDGEVPDGGILEGMFLHEDVTPNDREKVRDSRALDDYMEKANKENEELVKEYRKLKKNNIEINEEMNEDIKILLNMFGIPYVQSPCEAEAQCSYLNCKNYCDAIISDDSDVLVFNGKTVIKNFFNKKKTVEVYERKLIEDKLGLYQDELINLSLLCGCDYTIGVHGVGIVNALEIIKAFPTFEDLKKLKEIVSNPFRDLSKDDKYFNNEEVQRFLKTHKNYKLNWIFPKNFPDREVYKCFKYPKVCTDIEKFQWHLPNLTHISRFLQKETNIAEEKIYNVLNPILQKYDVKVRSYQLKIHDFFPMIERKRKSVDNLIDIIRDNQKGKRRSTNSGKRGKDAKSNKATSGRSSTLGRDITSLIDLNPAGVIRSKRMTTALDHIKGRGRSRKRASQG
ncbi:DNA repair protein RAD2, putative [Plasmodium knowlesi strain H]|uniref:DNA repair protein RAD2, putative n=2 Tax=Plasmodium knowlesi TaxID=5850 RepID=B3L0U1_PLAKH|nr:DNA repair protein RAD2, putative [Plasmodium knowlesi strain H]OTN66664.1 putative DNA repair endonuclease [Plasmodium knowlesi]CAA9986789.1 DNA repair protein RAD2, putative [Plasmodium knowlesi strain H]VVS76263.1 DNA repair protein RAD2, putative [Plasmodium knowlesi strain H]|eukprot:XP_002257973.1 DNA repair endonuclease, putative [Plasmodium knowlesi strain H]